ncbi:MAG: FecR domain-containing protein [Burkholderiales bacterium]|nr:FecR domain-containing protein [Burkholderiales bacterium]
MGHRGALHAASFIRAGAAAGALLLTSAGAFAQTPPPTTELDVPAAGTLKIVDGDVRVVGTDYEERRVKPGDRIASTERLVTGRESAASVVLRDGTVMALGPRTNLDLSRFNYNATTQEGSLAVRLVRGSMRMITGLIGRSNPDAVTVATRTATVGIRGTDFIVTVDEANP